MENSGTFNEDTDTMLRALTQRLMIGQKPTSSTPAQVGALKSYLSSFDKPASQSVEENKYYDKYKEKLERLKKEKPSQYSSAVKDVYENKEPAKQDGSQNKQSADVKRGSMAKVMKSSNVAGSSPKTVSPTPVQRPGLDSIMKLDLLRDKTALEITELWNSHHASKDCLYAVIPVSKYARLAQKGEESPLFIYPLPRGDGYEFFLGQYSRGDWYYTPLISYQTHQEYAPYSLCVRYYTELCESKGIVLMRGESASDDMKMDLAALLVHQTQLFYGSDDNYLLVKIMTESPDTFKHMDVVDICKKAGLF